MSATPEATMSTVTIFKAIVRSVSVFGVWGWVDIVGASILLVGCGGELWLLLNKLPEHNERRTSLKGSWVFLDRAESIIRLIGVKLKIIRPRKFSDLKEHLLEGFFISLVAIGVGMEVCSLPFSLHESATSNLEAKQAETNAATSYERAALALRAAGQANERTTKTELRVAELTHSNLVLQSSLDETKTELANAEMQVIKVKNAIPPRQIPEKQIELFITTLLQATNSGSPKIDIKVFVQDGDDFEANNFAGTVRRMLNDAGYGTNGERVIKIPPFTASPGADSKNTRMPLIFAIFATDYDGKKIPLSMPTLGGNMAFFLPSKNMVQTELTNSQIPTMSYYSTNPNDILGGVCNLLRYFDFPPTELAMPGLLNPGEVAFYIPPQVQ
jgi:hypothetical protein